MPVVNRVECSADDAQGPDHRLSAMDNALRLIACGAHDQRFLEVDVGLQHAHHLVVDDVRIAHLHQLPALGLDRIEPDVALRIVQRIEVLPPVGVGRVALQAMLVLREERLRESRLIGMRCLSQALTQCGDGRLRGRDAGSALLARRHRRPGSSTGG